MGVGKFDSRPIVKTVRKRREIVAFKMRMLVNLWIINNRLICAKFSQDYKRRINFKIKIQDFHNLLQTFESLQKIVPHLIFLFFFLIG